MVIEKAYPIMVTTKVSFIGPRQYSLGGYNSATSYLLQEAIVSTLEGLAKKGPVKAYTNLMTYTEQMFASACMARDIPYEVILPCKNFKKRLPNIDEQRKLFETLVEHAESVEELGGSYTINKIHKSRQHLISKSEIILFHPHLLRCNYDFISQVLTKSKSIIIM